MVDLNIKDAKATGEGCGCGCGHEQKVVKSPSCGCPPECRCGCQNGKPCTCGEKSPQAQDAAGSIIGEYSVSGMTCDHCVKAVSAEVLAIAGVTDVAVDLESGTLRVVSAGPIDFDRIVEAVAEAGDEYTVA